MKKKKIVVLGSGLVGGPMARDLSHEFDVSLADIDKHKLDIATKNHKINGIACDLSDFDAIQKIVRNADLVISAVPGHMGFKTLETVIECGKNVVDIAFFPENLLLLDGLAQEKEVIAISDIGVAPGMSNILTAYAANDMDIARKARIMVGGLPKVRQLPWEYKAVFSPADVIEEYTRPARIVRNGEEVVMPALGERELIDIEGVGTLEAFVSDGLRSLVHTMDIPDMEEKTLRYPGHARLMEILRDAGFFSREKRNIRGQQISPLDVSSALLFDQWELKKGEVDITVMKISVSGIKDGKDCTITYDLYDEYDPVSGIHSMARTTGYTATITARMVLNGMYDRKGVSPPEYLGLNKGCVSFLFDEFNKRGIHYRESRA